MNVSLRGSVEVEQVRSEELHHLVHRACRGDSEAFGRLYDLHLDAVYRYVYYKVSNASEAEDLTAQIFLKAWEAMPRFQWREIPFSHWLMRLARNAVIDHYRTSRNHGDLDESMMSQEPDPQGEYLRGEELQHLALALRSLPEEQRMVLLLRFVEEMDYAQVAEILGKSQGALRVIQHRALAALRRLMEREDGADAGRLRASTGLLFGKNGAGCRDAGRGVV